jgi:hypothetical protein
MGMTTPQAYRLGNGQVVTSANPAPVWNSPIAMQQHDVSVVARLIGSSRPRGAAPVEPTEERRLDEEDTAVYGRHFD